jgi:hypothetical protein
MRATISARRLSRLPRSHHELQRPKVNGSSESVAVPTLLLDQSSKTLVAALLPPPGRPVQ